MKHPKTYSLPASPSLSSSPSPSPTSPLGSSRSFHSPASLMGLSPGLSRENFSAFHEKPDFIELLARSNFSFLHGASHPEELVVRAKTLGYKGLAICDVNGLYGVVRGYQAAEKPSAFDAEQLAFMNADGTPKTPFHYMCGAELTPYDSSPLVLLPMNKDGYVRLCHLLTQAKRRAPKGHIVISLKHVLESNEDLLVFPLPPWKEPDLKKLQDAFQDRVYLPVCKDFSWESVRYFQQAMKIETSLGIALFATQMPLFHKPDRKPLHDVLTCILHKTTLAEAATRLTLNCERYLKSPEQILALFRERPDLLSRTLEIASRVQFSLSELRYRYPQENLPLGKTATDFLRELVKSGIEWRYPIGTPPEFMIKVRRQVEHELKMIQEMEYEDYFLTLWDICLFARERGILHQGRGSAANSIVCFALGLTSVDPVKLGLLFERFISRERAEPPDIDIDFEHERREEVIQYIYTKYGDRRAAMVCTVITYRSRMAIREVAKVMGIPLAQIGALIKYMGREGLSRLVDIAVEKGLTQVRPKAQTKAEAPKQEIANIDLSQFGLSEEKFQKLLHIALEMQGFPRHIGIHSGGFVVAQEPLIDIVPVEAATMEGRYVIQWNKDDISILGLMKIDVLALGMLTAIQKALQMLRQHKNIDWDLSQIPQDDPGTYAMIQKADTIGVFQIESRAQMSLLPRMKPRNYYDLVIEVAIVRPGPIQGGMVHPYLNRRAGREKITYAHPALVSILKKTLGIPLFQEQIMQIAVAVAGFTPGEADELRRVVSSAWKKKAVMNGLRQRVINGMLANGISLEYAEQVYKTIEGFSSYGFPESHAASFALITYASCYLKHRHPDIFTCALLNSQPMGFYSPRQLIADAQRHGIQFLALDVQCSNWDYTLETALTAAQVEPSVARSYDVRVGLRSVYGVNEEQACTLVEERKARGAFRDLPDLVRRTRLSRTTLVRIASSGALNSFGLNPRQALWALQGMSFDPQSLLFGEPVALDYDRAQSECEIIPVENSWENVRREYQTKGFALDSHPMAVLRTQLLKSHLRYVTAKQIEGVSRNSVPVRVAGLMSLLQKPPTAKGMCFISLEDETGLMNIIITPDLYQKCRLTLLHSSLLEIEGCLEYREGVRNIKAHNVRPLNVTS
jgi:DNA-directed DNA polymerase III PolC